MYLSCTSHAPAGRVTLTSQLEHQRKLALLSGFLAGFACSKTTDYVWPVSTCQSAGTGPWGRYEAVKPLLMNCQYHHN